MYEPHEILGDSIETDDQREGRVYGAIEGKITDVSDPQGLGRVCAFLSGMTTHINPVTGVVTRDQTDWLDPAWPGAFESTPNVDDIVIVMFVEGDPHRGFYFCHPFTTSKNRPTQAGVLGTQFIGMYNDLVAKFNALQSNYQAFYAFVQGHSHAALGAVSASMVAALMDPTAKNSGTNTGKGQDKDGAAVSPTSSDAIALSGKVKLR